MFGVTVHPPGAGTYDGVAQFLANPQPVTGLGDKATIGQSGGAATLVVSKKGNIYSFGSGPSVEQVKRAAQVILAQLP